MAITCERRIGVVDPSFRRNYPGVQRSADCAQSVQSGGPAHSSARNANKTDNLTFELAHAHQVESIF